MSTRFSPGLPHLLCRIAVYSFLVLAQSNPILGRQQPGRSGREAAADLVLFNGKVITVDAQDNVFSAVAVSGGRISAVGTDQEISHLIGPATLRIDLHGLTLTPGLIDSHGHVGAFGQAELYWVNLRPPEVLSIGDVVAVIAKRVEITPVGEWVIGDGFFELAEKRLPNRWDLDPVSPNHPVFLISAGGHFGTANSRALEIAGIDLDTPDPVGGTIERDPVTGEPNGVLWNHQAMDLVRRYFPVVTRDQHSEYLRFGQDLWLAQGFTGFQDVNTRTPTRLAGFWDAESDLKLRAYLLYTVERKEDADFVLAATQLYKGSMLTYNGCKFLLDGQAPTAFTYEPHPGPSWDKPTWDPAVLKQTVKSLHKAGHQLAFHVMGDAAIDLALDAVEEALADTPRADHRHRLEHIGIPRPESIQRMKQLDMVAGMHPGVIYTSGSAFLAYWGVQRCQRLMPLRSVLDAGIPLALGSDYPEALVLSPQLTLWSAVERIGNTGVALLLEEGITIQEALRAYTMGSAFAAFEENEKGSIEVGKLADFSVWSGDLYTVPSSQIKDLRVVMTIVGGRIVSRLGDLNFDGDLDITDAVRQGLLASGIQAPTDAQALTGDMSGDGRLDLIDWALALEAVADLEEQP